jgi:hypothetical protein
VKAFPLCRLAEFVIGIGLALRVKGRSEYVQIDGGGESEKAGGEDDKTVAYLPMIAVFIVVVYEIVQNATWDSTRCNCLNDDFVGCYGWFEVLDNKFALMSAVRLSPANCPSMCPRLSINHHTGFIRVWFPCKLSYRLSKKRPWHVQMFRTS